MLDIRVTRSQSATETLAKVNASAWPEIIEGRGIRVPWRVLLADPNTGISIEIEQPLQVPESHGPRRDLPKDVLEPLPAHARVSPTTEELNFRDVFLQYAPEAVPVMRPPMPWKGKRRIECKRGWFCGNEGFLISFVVLGRKEDRTRSTK